MKTVMTNKKERKYPLRFDHTHPDKLYSPYGVHTKPESTQEADHYAFILPWQMDIHIRKQKHI